MANGKIEYSKPELLDIGGVGEVTSGQDPWCLGGSFYVCCHPGSRAGSVGCEDGSVVGTGCRGGASPGGGYPCTIGGSVY